MNDKTEKQREEIAKEHGIGQQPALNPNPGANDNVKTPGDNPKPDPKATDKPGSEITDGGAG